MLSLGLRLGMGPARGASGVALDFTGGALPGSVTLTRASTGTYQTSGNLIASAAINAARFDYQSGGSCLLIEPARQNEFTYSEQFDNAAWPKQRATISANATASPDGTTTADKLIEDATAANTHQISRQSTTVLASTSDPRSLTFYAKANTRTKVMGVLQFNTGCFATFDLATGLVTASGGLFSGKVPTLAAMYPLANGWYKCVLAATFQAGDVGGAVYANVRLCDATGSDTYNGDNASGAFVWGAQIEVGAVPTSYVPTVAAAVTRSADAAAFTIPAGVATLRYTFDDNTTQDVAVVPGAYVIPTTLNRPRIKRIANV